MIKHLKKDSTYLYIIIFLAFELAIFLIHLPMQIVSDDEVNIARGVFFNNVFSYIVERFQWNGKFMTDGMAFILYCFPFYVFKIFDSFIYGIMLYIIWNLFTDRSIRMLITSAMGITLFPIISYLGSAGYIATTTNYIYPIILLLIGATPLIKKMRNQQSNIICYPLSIIGLIYTANQDQTAVVAIGGFLLVSIEYLYLWNRDKDIAYKKIFNVSAIYLCVSIIIYVLMLIVPGHIRRVHSTVEMEYWLPQYADWSIGYKLYRGIATTFANLFFLQPILFIVFTVLLLIIVYLKNRKMTIIPLAMLSLLILSRATNLSYFITYYDYSCNMPDLLPFKDAPVSLLMSLLIFLLLFFSVLAIKKTNEKTCYNLIILNILGFGSRFMMGFSATIYASSFRTFTFQVFSFLLCSILLINIVYESIIKKGEE